MIISGSDHVVRVDDHVSTTVEREEVILEFESDPNYGLGDFGTRVWELIENPQSIDDLVDTTTSEFDLDHSAARTDVLLLIGDLYQQNVVELCSETPDKD